MMICEGYFNHDYEYCKDCHIIMEGTWKVCPNSILHEEDTWCRIGGGRGLSSWEDSSESDVINNTVNCHKHQCISVTKL